MKGFSWKVAIILAVVALSVTAASKLLGVKITGLNSLMIILMMTAVPFVAPTAPISVASPAT